MAFRNALSLMLLASVKGSEVSTAMGSTPTHDGNIIGNVNSTGHDNGVNVNVNVLGIQDIENVKSAHVNSDDDSNMNDHDNGVNVNVNVDGIQKKQNIESLRSMPSALSSPTHSNGNAPSINEVSDNSNGHDNGVNVNVNVLGIQRKENVESADVKINGDKNENGHDNGVNVNVNVLGIQKIGNGEAANIEIDGDDILGIAGTAKTLLESMLV